MIPAYRLLTDIRAELQKGFKGMFFREPVNDGQGAYEDGAISRCEPHFFIQSLPPKRSKEEQGEDFPYILIKYLKGVGDGQPRQYAVSIGIVFGVFDPSYDPEIGCVEAMNMGERILLALCSKMYWADRSFVQEDPVNLILNPTKAEDVYDSRWQLSGPYFGGVVMTQFHAACAPTLPPPGIIDAP